jgi:hypothetical protein
MQRAERRADQHHHQVFAEEEVDNPNTTLNEEDPR